jgi:methyl-accepting chemotaxis protein
MSAAIRHRWWARLGAWCIGLASGALLGWVSQMLAPMPAVLLAALAALVALALHHGALALMPHRLSGRAGSSVRSAAEDVQATSPYLSMVHEHLQKALQDSETSALKVIERMNSIHRGSIEQLERIRCTESNGQELSRIMKEKSMVDSQLGAILQMFVETQEKEVQANLERLQRLQEVKGLGELVDVIANVAQQTNFLSINAAIEAARAGESGRSFAVLASEIRELSRRTGNVAIDINQRIAAATQGIDAELTRVTDASSRNTNSNNMRQVIDDIAQMQTRFAQSMEQLRLQQVIEDVLDGHQAIEAQIADAMGDIQTQDILRQRIECVQDAIQGLDSHLNTVAATWQGGRPTGDTAEGIDKLMHDQQARYANLCQTAMDSPSGRSTRGPSGQPSGAQAPMLELF